MKVLVTGGAGFIGSNIVRGLVQEGHNVTVLDNLLSGFRQNLEPFPDVRFVEGDIRNSQDLERSIKGAEIIFHLAASVGNKRSIDLPVDDADINLLGTIKLLEAARKHEVRKIVVSSSAGIFGELKTLPINENHPIAPISPYGVSKLAEEKISLVYQELYGIDVACLRYFNVYGPNQRFDAYGNVIPIFAYQLLRGEPITIHGDGEQTRDFVNASDVVQANMKAAFTKGANGVFNIASSTRISINRLVELLFEISRVEVKVIHGPPRIGDVRHSLADISAAKKAFGYEPKVEITEGLREYWKWIGIDSENDN